jgi:hypothetical protein
MKEELGFIGRPVMKSSLCLACWLCFLPLVKAEERYFTTIYSAQRPIINLPQFTHTWVTFVKLTRSHPQEKYQVETFTISWLPVTLEVRPRKIIGEPGRNLTPRETIDWCHENRMEIRQFGPFEVQSELFELMRERHGQFERGEKKYRASDIIHLTGEEEASNCTYAVVAPVARQQRFRPVTLGFGYIAGAYVMRRYSDYILDDTHAEHWVSELTGVETFRQMRLGLLRSPAE